MDSESLQAFNYKSDDPTSILQGTTPKGLCDDLEKVRDDDSEPELVVRRAKPKVAITYGTKRLLIEPAFDNNSVDSTTMLQNTSPKGLCDDLEKVSNDDSEPELVVRRAKPKVAITHGTKRLLNGPAFDNNSVDSATMLQNTSPKGLCDDLENVSNDDSEPELVVRRAKPKAAITYSGKRLLNEPILPSLEDVPTPLSLNNENDSEEENGISIKKIKLSTTLTDSEPESDNECGEIEGSISQIETRESNSQETASESQQVEETSNMTASPKVQRKKMLMADFLRKDIIIREGPEELEISSGNKVEKNYFIPPVGFEIADDISDDGLEIMIDKKPGKLMTSSVPISGGLHAICHQKNSLEVLNKILKEKMQSSMSEASLKVKPKSKEDMVEETEKDSEVFSEENDVLEGIENGINSCIAKTSSGSPNISEEYGNREEGSFNTGKYLITSTENTSSQELEDLFQETQVEKIQSQNTVWDKLREKDNNSVQSDVEMESEAVLEESHFHHRPKVVVTYGKTTQSKCSLVDDEAEESGNENNAAEDDDDEDVDDDAKGEHNEYDTDEQDNEFLNENADKDELNARALYQIQQAEKDQEELEHIAITLGQKQKHSTLISKRLNQTTSYSFEKDDAYSAFRKAFAVEKYKDELFDKDNQDLLERGVSYKNSNNISEEFPVEVEFGKENDSYLNFSGLVESTHPFQIRSGLMNSMGPQVNQDALGIVKTKILSKSKFNQAKTKSNSKSDMISTDNKSGRVKGFGSKESISKKKEKEENVELREDSVSEKGEEGQPKLKRAFTKWVNTKINALELQVDDLTRDLHDGVVLLQLLQVISNKNVGKFNKKAKLRIQKVENLNLALQFIKQNGVHLTNIGAEDITDGNEKLILGMIWTIILRFTIADISEEGKSAKEGLLLWCQRKTANYNEVKVKDFTHSWQSGLALCALIHRHRPDLLDYHALDKSDNKGNTSLAFEVAERDLGIARLLDVEDLCDVIPDERSVMTYVAQYFHAFSSMDKVSNAGRRVANFINVANSTWEMKHDYEERLTRLNNSVEDTAQSWKSTAFDGTYYDVRQKAEEFKNYKVSLKREWMTEKRKLEALLGNIQTKLKTYNLPEYNPPEGLTLNDADNHWDHLISSEAEYRNLVSTNMAIIKENLRQEYARIANTLQDSLDKISHEIAGLHGDLEKQLQVVTSQFEKVPSLNRDLENAKKAHNHCVEANIEENDYTNQTVEDLQFEFEAITQSLNEKKSFIENQIVAKSLTNISPQQLEEFETTFRHFDKDHTNSLNVQEFKGAISALGILVENDSKVFEEVSGRSEKMTFQQFINYVVSIMQDQVSPEQILESFKALSLNKEYITDQDLRQAGADAKTIDYVKNNMQASPGGEGYDYKHFLNTVFPERCQRA